MKYKICRPHVELMMSQDGINFNQLHHIGCKHCRVPRDWLINIKEVSSNFAPQGEVSMQAMKMSSLQEKLKEQSPTTNNLVTMRFLNPPTPHPMSPPEREHILDVYCNKTSDLMRELGKAIDKVGERTLILPDLDRYLRIYIRQEV